MMGIKYFPLVHRCFRVPGLPTDWFPGGRREPTNANDPLNFLRRLASPWENTGSLPCGRPTEHRCSTPWDIPRSSGELTGDSLSPVRV